MAKTIASIDGNSEPKKLFEEFRNHMIKARSKKSLILETPDYIYVLYAADDTFEKRIEVSYIYMDKLLEVKELDAKEAVLALLEEVGAALAEYFKVPVVNEYGRLHALIEKVQKQVGA